MTLIRTGLHGHNGPGVVGATQMATGALGACLPWWDPNQVGLSCIGAYRAINSVGTPWPCGPNAYADSLINQVTPSTNDLIEGFGAVPWAAATGWSFVAAATQHFDTGLMPANDQSWSAFVQYANVVGLGSFYTIGSYTGVAGTIFGLRPALNAASLVYSNGGNVIQAPNQLAGNQGMGGNQGYRNGVADGGPIGAWGGVSNRSVYVGALNNTGVAANWITADIHAIAFYNGGAAAVQGQALAIATAMGQL